MREYSPKRRTALVLAGTGVSGAYHAGVLRALDESGIKIDLVVGSGAGAIAAAYAAVAGGPKLYGKGGFWDGIDWHGFFRLRPALRIAAVLLGLSFAFFLLPLALAAIAGLLFLPVLFVDFFVPGLASHLLGGFHFTPAAVRAPYLVALAAPIFVLATLAAVCFLRLLITNRRRVSETFEAFLDASPGLSRLRHGLWEIARGAALRGAIPTESELGSKYVALAGENIGQPGFRELILRTTDLETGSGLPFILLGEAGRSAFAAARSHAGRWQPEGIPVAVDLRTSEYESLFFDALATGILLPVGTPVRRITFPKRGLHGGQTHRLTDATVAGGCGISEALAAGAEQVIVVTAAPESPGPPPRKRGPRALLDATLAALEQRAVEQDVHTTERLNRIVDTLGHVTGKGDRAWEDPATGRRYRGVALWMIRPQRRLLGPLELDGARDPATEALTTPADVLDLGYRDAYKQFVEPVVGAVPESRHSGAAEVAPTVEL